MVLASGLLVGCAQDATLSPTAPPLAPVEQTNSTALRNYFSKAVPIVEDHTKTMNTVYEAVEAIKALGTGEAKGIQIITVEAIKQQLQAQGIFVSGISKMEKALQKMGSEIVDFGILSPPAEAMGYHNLVVSYFLKDKVALSDWLYYYTTLRERRYRDNEALDRADRHYKQARELQLQAEQEWKALQQKIR